jgi:hypothetical protein
MYMRARFDGCLAGGTFSIILSKHALCRSGALAQTTRIFSRKIADYGHYNTCGQRSALFQERMNEMQPERFI